MKKKILKGREQKPDFPYPGEDPLKDTASVMKFYKLPSAFSKAVIEEAKNIDKAFAKEPINTKGRIDLRGHFIFTCDPTTARDFDDALSIEVDRKGNRELGVHIADVSHYVRPGSAIDREAFKRSTSVYFCDRVVPMLPESLCNGVCSLKPDEDRYAFSVFMKFDAAGNMIARRFAKTVIRSKYRFSYEQVMAIITASKHSNASPKNSSNKLPKKELKKICEIADLAQQLRARRIAAGALDIEIPEAEVMLDDYGELESIVTRPYDQSHQMIEECMVAANEAVATELRTNGVKILSRFHDAPDEEKLELLRAEFRSLGIKMGNISNKKVFAQFLLKIKSSPLYPTLAMMVLRSMKRAVYDSQATGHFGLAKKYYAHFTSPIRRYPDLILHRLLLNHISGSKVKTPPRLLEKWAEHSTKAEETATDAERALVEIKKYRLLQNQLSSRIIPEYEGVIVKCAPYGCFVEIADIAVSGLVHISALSNRFVQFNEYDQSLSSSGGSKWRIGDRMRVKVLNVDMRQRKIDFMPIFERRRKGR